MRLNSEFWGKKPQSSNFLKIFFYWVLNFLILNIFSEFESKQVTNKSTNQKKQQPPNKNIQPNKYTKQKYIFWIPNSASIFLKIFCLLRFLFSVALICPSSSVYLPSFYQCFISKVKFWKSHDPKIISVA